MDNTDNKLNIMTWPLVVGAMICDLLGLCHMIPTHSQHMHRPHIMSMVQFKVFNNSH